MPKPLAILLATLVCFAAARAHADRKEDFAFEVKESTGDHHRAWIVSKLTTFKLGAKCWDQVVDRKEYAAVAMAGHYTKSIAAYAKHVTGDDWSKIEHQSNDREANRKLVEPMVDAFRGKLSVTVAVEGDACDPKHAALWLKYWTAVGRTLSSYPPKAGKVSVTLNVTAKAKALTVAVDKAGATFTITAPRDIEPSDWENTMSKPFRKLAEGL